MGVVPRDMQHILGKSSMVEKIVDTHDKAALNRHDAVVQDMQKDADKKSTSVKESEESEGKNIDAKEEKKRRQEEERQRKERRKEIARRLNRDLGHIIDLEA